MRYTAPCIPQNAACIYKSNTARVSLEAAGCAWTLIVTSLDTPIDLQSNSLVAVCDLYILIIAWYRYDRITLMALQYCLRACIGFMLKARTLIGSSHSTNQSPLYVYHKML